MTDVNAEKAWGDWFDSTEHEACYPSFLAGRASRDAEAVEGLAVLARAENAWRAEVDSLRQQLADAGRDLHTQLGYNAELHALIERLSDWVDRNLDTDTDVPFFNEFRAIASAPSAALDAVKADAWDEGYEARVQQVESEQRYDTSNPYPKGGDRGPSNQD